MTLHSSKASGSVVMLLAGLAFVLLLLGTGGSARAQDRVSQGALEGEEDLCVCGLAFYDEEMTRVLAEIVTAREADDDAEPYYALIRKWARLRLEVVALNNWCQAVPLPLPSESEALSCPGNLQD